MNSVDVEKRFPVESIVETEYVGELANIVQRLVAVGQVRKFYAQPIRRRIVAYRHGDASVMLCLLLAQGAPREPVMVPLDEETVRDEGDSLVIDGRMRIRTAS